MRYLLAATLLATLAPAPAAAALMITSNESFFITDTGAELLPLDALVAPDETRTLPAITEIGSARFTTTLGPLSAIGQGVNGRYGGDFLSLANRGSSLSIDFAPGTFAFGFRLGATGTTSSTQICVNATSCFFNFPASTGFRFFGLKDTAGIRNVSFNLTGSQTFDLAALRVADAAVPEPASWAMLIAGFGLAGAMLRRRQEHLAVA